MATTAPGDRPRSFSIFCSPTSLCCPSLRLQNLATALEEIVYQEAYIKEKKRNLLIELKANQERCVLYSLDCCIAVR